MKKIFIKFYLLVLGTLAVGLLIIAFVFIPVLDSVEKRDDIRVMRGLFALAVNELAQEPQERWEEQIAAMRRVSGGIISLVSLKSVVDRHAVELADIEDGALVSIYETDTFFKRMKNSEWVVRLKPLTHGSFWYTGDDERVLALTLYLINGAMERGDEPDPVDAFDHIRGLFGFPVVLLKGNPVFKSEEGTASWKQAGSWADIDVETVWCKLSDTGFYLRMGPLMEGQSYLLRFALYGVIGLFLTLIGVSAFLWTRPLWRDLDRLSFAAERFGKGDLKSRAHTSTGSAVAGLAHEFNAMANEIEAEISYRIELADAISHELRTPLARLQFAFGMREETKEEGEKSALTQEMAMNLDELDALIQELLDYSRMEHGFMAPKVQPVPLQEWLDRCLEPFVHDHPAMEIAHRCVGLGAGEMGQFEPRLMARALTNLLGNAVRYAEKRVSVVLQRVGEELYLSVEDDGCGVPEAHREKVFVPFLRLDPSRDRASGNHGLGLSIVRSILSRHQGRVVVETSAMGGARFCMRWPRSTKDQEAVPQDDLIKR